MSRRALSSSRFLTGGKAAVSELAAFLADVYTSIHSTFALPADSQHQLRSEFADCLTAWAHAGVEVDPYRSAVEDLFVALATVRAGIVSDAIYTILGTSAFTDDDDMRAFAIAVRRRLG